MSKRQFGVNVSAIPDNIPTIAAGIYVGTMTGASVVGRNDKQYINVVPETVWNDKAINEKTGKAGAFVPTGDYIIEGSIYYRVTLQNDDENQPLPLDEMTINLGRVRLIFDRLDAEQPCAFSQEMTQYGPVNRVFKQFTEALGISPDDLDLNNAVSYTGDEELIIPEELQGVEGIEDLLHYCNWYREYFNLYCEEINGTMVKVQVKEEQDRTNPELKVNVIDTGNYNSFSGILKYEG